MTDLVEWLETAISEAELLATAREETKDGWTETGWWVTRRTASGDLDPLVHHSEDQARTALARHQNAAAVLRRCAADRKILAAIRRGVAGHPGPCINYEEQDPADYSAYDTCERHIEWSETAVVNPEIQQLLLDALAEGYGYQEVS